MEAGGAGWQGGEADIDFGVSDLNAKFCEAVQIGDLVGFVGCLANDEMTLQADAVDLDPTGFQARDKILGGRSFGARIFDVVVVVI